MARRASSHRRTPSGPSRTAAPPVVAPDDSAWFADRIRTIALGLTAALVVSRAYWPAEGTTELMTGEQLPWTFALLATASLAVVGAMLGRSLRFRFCWADLAVIGLMFAVGLSASHALDRRVAINLAWQWGGVGVVYVLLRNLPRSRAETRALAGILAATATAVSCYAVYQVGVELPELRRLFLENPRQLLAQYPMAPTPGTPEYRSFVDRVVGSTEAFATFGLANSLAGYIVGPLVVGIGVLLAGVARTGRQRLGEDAPSPGVGISSIAMAALPVLLVLVVLLLTKSRSGFLGLVVGTLILSAAFARRLGRRALLGGAVGLIAAIGAAGGALWRLGFLDRAVLTQSTLSLRYRFEYWVGTWRVLADGAWRTGLGPGNFRPAYRQFKLVEASEDVVDPHNLFLEVWEVAGILALVLLVLGLGLTLWNLFGPSKASSETSSPPPSAGDPNPNGSAGSLLVWAGLGGWVGVVLLGDLNLFSDDNDAIARWLLLGLGWGLAVALAGPLWAKVSPPAVAIGAAVLAMVVNLLAAGGIGYASVSSMLWGLAAVGLNLREDRPAGRLRELPGLFPPFVVAAVLSALLGTFYGTVSPYWRSQALMKRADAILAERPTAPRQEDLEQVADLLQRAIAADSYASRPYLALAELELLAWISRGSPPEDAVWNRIVEILEDAITPPRDPRSLEVRAFRVNLARRILAARPDLPSAARDRLRTIIATDSFVIAERLTPTSPLAHAQAAEDLAALGQFRRAAREAEKALELDARTPHQDKKLPEALRDRLADSIPNWLSPSESHPEDAQPLDDPTPSP
ncbi:O-antigen ligase family protein [Tautonia sociabilis]|uniref:O-antigen ligase domain-containing protein n=1 Tax=Tautonia sociabilis TaxID=2080755 RepID=A0A432MNN6_9BACT|nr:O-antigen ligase family protein [Tautonia sociabilis]RUL89022.1 O-antigen ligase domain-containing protein [Tautonia sociabilis]